MYSLDDIKVVLKNPEQVKHFIEWHGETACVCYNTNPKYANKVGESVVNDRHFSGSRGNYFIFEIECPRFTADQIMRHEVGTFKNCQSQRYVDMDDNFSIYVPPTVMNEEKLRKEYERYEEQCKAQYKALRMAYNECGVTGEKANDLMRTMLPIGVEKLRKEYERYEEQCKAQYKALRMAYNECGVTGEKANDLMRTMLPIGVKTKLVIGFTIEALENFMNKRLCTRADLPIRRVAYLMKNEVVKNEVEPRYEHLLQPQCKRLLYCPEKHSCNLYPTKTELQHTIELGYQKLFELKEDNVRDYYIALRNIVVIYIQLKQSYSIP